MGEHFLTLTAGAAAQAAQRQYYGRTIDASASEPEPLGEVEQAFIAGRDSCYLATVTDSGWPYLQHRGGPPGFLRVLDARTLAFADVRGNRQMITTGNVAGSDRVALFLMDYPQRSRLKILGHATIVPAVDAPDLAASLSGSMGAPAERLVTVRVVAFDWNCPKFITPRYTKVEIDALLQPLQRRIAELEGELKVRGAASGTNRASTNP